MPSTHYNNLHKFPNIHSPHLRFVLVESKVQAKNQSQDTDDQHDDPEQPPFQPAGALGGIDALVQLHVSGFGVVLDVLCVLLGLLNHWFLNDNGFGEILEELVKLHKCAFDALDIVVTSANGAKNSRSGCCSVGLELSTC